MSEVLIISLLVNLSLIILGLIFVIPKVNSYISRKKRLREKHLETLIKGVVNEYLNELKK